MKKLLTTLLAILMVVTVGTVNVFGEGEVAQIGENKYGTLQDAIDAVQNNETITLISDVTVGEINNLGNKTFTIDLSNKTMSTTKDDAFTIDATNLTVKNGTINHSVAVGDAWEPFFLKGENEGSLTLNDVDITSPMYSVYASSLSKNKTVNINNCNFISTDDGVIYVGGADTSNEINITDSKLENSNTGTAVIQLAAEATFENITITSTSATALVCFENTDLLIKGTENSFIAKGGAISTNGSKDLVQITIEGGTFKSTSSSDEDGIAFYHPDGSPLTIKGGTFEGATALYVKGGTIDIQGGSFIGTGAYQTATKVSSGAKATGDAVVIEASGYLAEENYNPDPNPSAVISGGLFKSTYGSPVAYYTFDNNEEDHGGKIISGGYFNKEVNESIISPNYECIDTPETDLNHDNYPYMIGEKAKVAQIDDNKYYTLADAIAAVPTDGTKTTIKILENINYSEFNAKDGISAAVVIPSSKNIVLDLNGKTISGTSNANAAAYLLHNKGTLTIVDAKEAGKITYKSNGPDNSYRYGTSTILNRGVLTMESGTVENTTIGGASYAVDNQTLWYDDIVPVVFNMNGGNVECTTGDAAIRQGASLGTKYTKGGEIVKNYVTVSGGTVTGDIWVQNSNNSYTDLKITDGVITGRVYDNAGTTITNLSYSITGGLIEKVSSGGGKEKFVSGGWFTEAVDSKYVCDGYIPSGNLTGKGAPNEVNVYTVVKDIPTGQLDNEETGKVKVDDNDVDTTFGTKVTIDETLPTEEKEKISNIQVSNLNKAISETEKNNTIVDAATKALDDATPTVEVEVIMNVDIVKSSMVESLAEKIAEDKKAEFVSYGKVEYIDITIDKIVKANGNVIEIKEIKTTDSHQIISFPIDSVLGSGVDKEKIFVYRNHVDENGIETNKAFMKVEKDYGPSYDGECYWIDGDNIYIKANNFSVYGFGVQDSEIPAIKKLTPTPGPTPSSDDSNVGGYKIPKTGIR